MNRSFPWKSPVRALLTVLLAASFSSSLFAQVGEVIWEEQFDSLSHWNIATGNGEWGWGNGELQYYQSENVEIVPVPGEPDNNALSITARRETGDHIVDQWGNPLDFTSGRLNTKGRVAIHYGLIEVRVRVPDLDLGGWPAVWLLGTANKPWPDKGEIDMMEMGHGKSMRDRFDAYNGGDNSNSSTVNQMTGANVIFHTPQAESPSNPSGATMIALDENYNRPYFNMENPLNDRFVTYRAYWDNQSIRFTVVDEGDEHDLYTAPFTFDSNSDEFTEPFYMILNMAIGGHFTDAYNLGDPDSGQPVTMDMPATMYVDYIKVSKWNGKGEVTISTPEPGPVAIEFTLTFDEDNLDYEITDFGGNYSELVTDPEDADNTVVKTLKTGEAETWAGTTVASSSGFAQPLPFEEGQTSMNVKVWSPEAGIPVRLKVEDLSNSDISVETEDTTTTAKTWETLTFDFSNEISGTAALDVSNTYNIASIFFNFGTSGTDAGEQTYYWDDVAFGKPGDTQPEPEPDTLAFPIRFEENVAWDEHLIDFDGGESEIIANPDPGVVNESEQVLKMVKGSGQTWAGSYLNMPEPLEITKDFTITAKVWAPRDDTKMLLKIEHPNDMDTFVEQENTIETGEEWVETTFDLSNADTGTDYQKVVIIFDNGTAGDGSADYTWYVDDLRYGTTTSIHNTRTEIPKNVQLSQNYPNPFNPSTKIDFALPAKNKTTLHVYNVMGQQVATLMDKKLAPGQHSVTFNASGLSSGIYFYQLTSGSVQLTRQLTLIK